MANKRMFSREVTESGDFIMLPSTARDLYFLLGMQADDEGYCEYIGTMRMYLCQQSDLQLLFKRGFVHVFDHKVLLILHWDINNLIQKDRKKKSRLKEKYPYDPSGETQTFLEFDNEEKEECIQNVSKSDTNVSRRVVKSSIDKVSIDKTYTVSSKNKKNGRLAHVPYEEIINDLNEKSGKKFQVHTEATINDINKCWDWLLKHPDYKDDPLKAFFKVNSNMKTQCEQNINSMQFFRPSCIYRAGKLKNNFENLLTQGTGEIDYGEI